MENINKPSSPSKLPIVTIGEWLMILPATVLLAAAALRSLGGRGPLTRTGWFISEWVATHVSRLGAALLFIGMPAVVVIMGCATLLRIWREGKELRQDAVAALTIVRRHLMVGLLTVATLLAGAILTAVLAHVITD